MADEDGLRGSGMMPTAVDELLERARTLVHVLGSVGKGARGALPDPVTPAVNRLLDSVQQIIDQAPPFTAQIDILMGEITAKRLTLQALQAELASFDRQLEVLQRSMAPLENWARQSVRLQESLTETLSAVSPDRGSPSA